MGVKWDSIRIIRAIGSEISIFTYTMSKIIKYNRERRASRFRAASTKRRMRYAYIGSARKKRRLRKKLWRSPDYNDGVTIAKEITLSDKFENMGAEIVKEVATKTKRHSGRWHDNGGHSDSSNRE